MQKRSAYTFLAEWFEYLNDDCGYEKWSQYLISHVCAFGGVKGLDVGCGSGYFTRAFAKAGYDMTGMDISPEMLQKAEEISRKTGLRCPYLLGDITAFKTHEKFDFALAVNDCLNYVKKDKLNAAFLCIHRALKKNGAFIFDVSSKRKFEKKVANTVSVDDRDDVTYLAFNKMDGDEVTMEVSLFVRQKDGSYVRFDERHVQYAHEKTEIVAALNNAGFEVIKTEGHLGLDETDADRITFVCQKR